MLQIHMAGVFRCTLSRRLSAIVILQHKACLQVVRECMILLSLERCREQAKNSLCGSSRRLNQPHFLTHSITTSWVAVMYCGSSLTRPPMVASLLRNGKILRASAVVRVGLNHQTVTGHITLATLKSTTAMTRFTLNFRKNHCIADAIL